MSTTHLNPTQAPVPVVAPATIPRTLHIIWVGDDTRRPDNCIATWLLLHPDWTVKLWGNEDLNKRDWRCAVQMQQLLAHDLRGVADLMRWEILADEGGVAVAADSLCLRRLPDELLAHEMFACWENELDAPGVIAADYVGARAGHPFLLGLVEQLAASPHLAAGPVRETTGALCLTAAWRAQHYARLSILPSHTFMPRHLGGTRFDSATGRGVPAGVLACELWATSLGLIDSLHKLDAAEMIRTLAGGDLTGLDVADALDAEQAGGIRPVQVCASTALNEESLRRLPLPRLFPSLNWKRPQLARAQAFAHATQALVVSGAWAAAAEYARATLESVTQLAAPAALPPAVPAPAALPEDDKVEATSPFVRELWARLRQAPSPRTDRAAHDAAMQTTRGVLLENLACAHGLRTLVEHPSSAAGSSRGWRHSFSRVYVIEADAQAAERLRLGLVGAADEVVVQADWADGCRAVMPRLTGPTLFRLSVSRVDDELLQRIAPVFDAPDAGHVLVLEWDEGAPSAGDHARLHNWIARRQPARAVTRAARSLIVSLQMIPGDPALDGSSHDLAEA